MTHTIVLNRLFQLAYVMVGISLITFAVISLSPGDPAEITLRATLGTESPPKEAVARLHEEMGLDEPWHISYLKWASRVVHGDLGYSYQTKRSTLEEITHALPVTISLAVLTMLISAAMAIPLGIIAALRQNGPVDHICRLSSVISLSCPEFFVAIIFMLVGGVYLGIFPIAGTGGIEHFILPSLTLSVGLAAVTMRIMRTSMIETLEQEYIRTARAKGLSRKDVIQRHALRNALSPVIIYMGTQFGWLFGGVVVIESMFALPGLGRLLVNSVSSMDIMVVQGCMLTFAVIIVLINLGVDLVHFYLDPAVRGQGE
ncbi:ABC transporter permease [Methanosarcina mazei]|uniref:Peptide ABC transporter permease n=2 Tax=Methanosarcina mazei TaxID=2209 RepID=A0A0F8M1A5_METMZ|nr:ABC transporter permease [Methanosarcina mazei]KKF98773.1 peptide ABC transporter permease [Methanosarcina mazei]KKG13723.1 peptide ABC transporter permease [Methanosarcina mazei]KKG28558.1 peptide ABC transporter permease [Methanosarcina mazei]KKG40886.1 peptide ABC transporter permease [Methanosarcina mazei]KKG45636.1 peptide ABC transporter permease [Methanosarcina mazei]